MSGNTHKHTARKASNKAGFGRLNKLCITIAANIAETVLLSYPACFPDTQWWAFPFDPSVVSCVRYVELFIRTVRTGISAYAPATAQKNINNEIPAEHWLFRYHPLDEQQPSSIAL